VGALHVTVLAARVKPVNQSVAKRFVRVGVGVKEQGGAGAYVNCLDQRTNQNHVCSLAEEMSLKWRRGRRPAKGRVNVLSAQTWRVRW